MEQAVSLLDMLRPAECVSFCETACIRPRADPEDDSPWPPAPGGAAVSTAVLVCMRFFFFFAMKKFD